MLEWILNLGSSRHWRHELGTLLAVLGTGHFIVDGCVGLCRVPLGKELPRCGEVPRSCRDCRDRGAGCGFCSLGREAQKA